MNCSLIQNPYEQVQVLSFSCASARANVRLQEERTSQRKDRDKETEKHTLGLSISALSSAYSDLMACAVSTY